MFVSVRPMPIAECRPMHSAQEPQASRKMILPAIPVSSSARQQVSPSELGSIPERMPSLRIKNPQALEAEIVRMGNQRQIPDIAPPIAMTPRRESQSEKIAPTGYRPLHMMYQSSTHSAIGIDDFQRKGFSFHFSWQDIFLFCLVLMVMAVITCSVLLIFL